jgi:hypothetical protein
VGGDVAAMRRGGVVEGGSRVLKMVGKGRDEKGEASIRSSERWMDVDERWCVGVSTDGDIG